MSFTSESTGGEYNHKLTTSEMPKHAHEPYHWASSTTAGWLSGMLYYGQKGTAGGRATSTTGGDYAHNNIQPYITVYFWRRTS